MVRATSSLAIVSTYFFCHGVCIFFKHREQFNSEVLLNSSGVVNSKHLFTYVTASFKVSVFHDVRAIFYHLIQFNFLIGLYTSGIYWHCFLNCSTFAGHSTVFLCFVRNPVSMYGTILRTIPSVITTATGCTRWQRDWHVHYCISWKWPVFLTWSDSSYTDVFNKVSLVLSLGIWAWWGRNAIKKAKK